MDTLKRYKTLPHTVRIIEMKRMLTDVFTRLAEQGGATPDDLRLLAEGLVEKAEKQVAEQRRQPAVVLPPPPVALQMN